METQDNKSLKELLDGWAKRKDIGMLRQIIVKLRESVVFQTELGQYLRDGVIDAAWPQMRLLRFKAGQVIHLAKDDPIGIFSIICGKVKVHLLPDGIDAMKQNMNFTYFLKNLRQDLKMNSSCLLIEQHGIDSIKKKFFTIKDKRREPHEISHSEERLEQQARNAFGLTSPSSSVIYQDLSSLPSFLSYAEPCQPQIGLQPPTQAPPSNSTPCPYFHHFSHRCIFLTRESMADCVGEGSDGGYWNEGTHRSSEGGLGDGGIEKSGPGFGYYKVLTFGQTFGESEHFYGKYYQSYVAEEETYLLLLEPQLIDKHLIKNLTDKTLARITLAGRFNQSSKTAARFAELIAILGLPNTSPLGFQLDKDRVYLIEKGEAVMRAIHTSKSATAVATANKSSIMSQMKHMHLNFMKDKETHKVIKTKAQVRNQWKRVKIPEKLLACLEEGLLRPKKNPLDTSEKRLLSPVKNDSPDHNIGTFNYPTVDIYSRGAYTCHLEAEHLKGVDKGLNGDQNMTNSEANLTSHGSLPPMQISATYGTELALAPIPIFPLPLEVLTASFYSVSIPLTLFDTLVHRERSLLSSFITVCRYREARWRQRIESTSEVGRTYPTIPMPQELRYDAVPPHLVPCKNINIVVLDAKSTCGGRGMADEQEIIERKPNTKVLRLGSSVGRVRVVKNFSERETLVAIKPEDEEKFTEELMQGTVINLDLLKQVSLDRKNLDKTRIQKFMETLKERSSQPMVVCAGSMREKSADGSYRPARQMALDGRDGSLRTWAVKSNVKTKRSPSQSIIVKGNKENIDYAKSHSRTPSESHKNGNSISTTLLRNSSNRIDSAIVSDGRYPEDFFRHSAESPASWRASKAPLSASARHRKNVSMSSSTVLSQSDKYKHPVVKKDFQISQSPIESPDKLEHKRLGVESQLCNKFDKKTVKRVFHMPGIICDLDIDYPLQVESSASVKAHKPAPASLRRPNTAVGRSLIF
jgi:hypothetical protein